MFRQKSYYLFYIHMFTGSDTYFKMMLFIRHLVKHQSEKGPNVKGNCSPSQHVILSEVAVL